MNQSDSELEDVGVGNARYCIYGTLTFEDADFEEGIPTRTDVTAEVVRVERADDSKGPDEDPWIELRGEELTAVLAQHGETFKKLMIEKAEDDAVDYLERTAER